MDRLVSIRFLFHSEPSATGIAWELIRFTVESSDHWVSRVHPYCVDPCALSGTRQAPGIRTQVRTDKTHGAGYTTHRATPFAQV